MKLTNIQMENLRGITRTLPLGALTILLGPNGTGKSSALDAVDYAIQGYVKRIGMKPDAVLPLFADGQMACGVEAINGGSEPIRVSRHWRRKRTKTGVGVELDIKLAPSSNARGVRDADAMVRQLFGVTGPALDLSELMDLTASQKRKLLFGFADLSKMGFDREGVLGRVRRAVITADVEANPQLLDVAEGQLAKLAGAWGATADVEEGLERLGKWAEETLRTSKADLKDAESSMRELADQVGIAGGEGSLEQTKADLAGKRSQLAQIERDITVDDERRRGVQSRAEAIESAKKRIDFYGKPSPDENTAAAAAEIERLKAEIVQVGEVVERDLAAAEAAEREADKAATRAVDALERIDREIASIKKALTALHAEDTTGPRTEIERLSAELGEATDSGEQIAEAEAAERETDKASARAWDEVCRLDRDIERLQVAADSVRKHDCPHCKCKPAVLRAAIDADRVRLEGERETARAAAAVMRGAQEQAASKLQNIKDRALATSQKRATIERLQNSIAKAEQGAAERARLDGELDRLQTSRAAAAADWERSRAENTAAAAKLSGLKDRASAIAARRSEIARHEKLISGAADAAKLREEKRKTQEQQLQRLQKEDAEAAPVADRPVLDAQLAALRATVTDLESRLGREQQAHGVVGSRKAAAVRKLTAENNVEILTAIKKAVGPSGVQGEVVTALLAPIAEAANGLLGLVRPGYTLAVQMVDERGDAVCDLGWRTADGRLVTWAQLSTGQRAIVGASIVVALLELTRPPLRLLKVDALECLDAENCAALLGALEQLIDAGRLDNVLLAGVTTHGPVSERWTVHELQSAAEASR